MAADWESLLLAYLHDPPDKALDIRGHVARACRYAGAALGRPVSDSEMKHLLPDVLASVAERLPAPNWTVQTVKPDQDKLRINHPLSGEELKLENCTLDEESVVRAIKAILQGVGDDRKWRLLALWRLLPERLANKHSWFAHLPADTRIPDHTIWHHLDTTTALKAAEEGGKGAAFLSFSLGPVQGFISTARSVRDLWSGSMILSWLTFRAMLPVIENYGPMAFVYPHLRGIPFLDRWLRESGRIGDAIAELDAYLRRAPCLPNRFLALVPWGPNGDIAHQLAEECEKKVRKAWQEIANCVHQELNSTLSSINQQWDCRWQEQIESFWDIQTTTLPLREVDDELVGKLLTESGSFKDAFLEADKVRRLADAIPEGQRPGYDQKHAGRWQAWVEVSARLMQAQRTIRHIPPSTPDEEVPPKCSLMGSYEQMGPAGLNDSRCFWEGDRNKHQKGAVDIVNIHGVRLRKGERFCAVALVKRFSAPAFFSKELNLDNKELSFDDTASVAAAEWLEKYPQLRQYSKKQRSSHWLHWARPDQEKEEGEEEVPKPIWDRLNEVRRKGRPPAYYAILVMDADHMGKWLRGEKSPKVCEVLHPELVKFFKNLPRDTKDGLDARRPLGPALHAALSEALANFALHFVPQIVEDHHGTLIYAGGDDVLALLPTSRALACALELRRTFQQNWAPDHHGRERLLPGERATVSAGLAVVHYKEDLRFALNQARKAEKTAKDADRDALQITVCRRSGEHSSAFCTWEFAPNIIGWVKAFRNNASDRWAYHLAAEQETLRGLDVGAMRSEIRRQLGRTEPATQIALRQAFQAEEGRRVGDLLAGQFDDYCRAVMDPERKPKHKFDHARALSQFVTLCQSASFLARGREQ